MPTNLWDKLRPLLAKAAWVALVAAAGYLAKELGIVIPPLDVIGSYVR